MKLMKFKKLVNIVENAIEPSAEMDIQLHDKEFPIDDDSWSPNNNKELGSALKQLAEKVPNRIVSEFWAWAINKTNSLSSEE